MSQFDEIQPQSQPQPQPETGQAASSSKKGLIVTLVALVVVLALGFAGYTLLSGQAASPEADTSALQPAGVPEDAAQPTFYLADFNATVYDDAEAPVEITAIADGKPFVMNFWATWCPYCIEEMDDFQAIYNDYSDRVSFAFVDATDGQRETVEDARAWMAENGHNLPTYYDSSLEAADVYAISVLPTTVVAGADGEILSVSAGRIDSTLLRRTLDTLV